MKKQNSSEKIKIDLHGGKIVKGVAIMSIAGIMSKVLGAFFRIPLANWIGAKGMAYYSAAYSIYSFFLFISMAGLPVAISRMISERNAIGDDKNLKKVFRVSIALMFSLGLISASALLFGANFISHKIRNPGSYLSMVALVPVLLLAPLVASFRGYFQGKQNMLPSGVSEIVEQLFRVIVGLSLAHFFLGKSLTKAAAGATFGASMGSFFAFILMAGIYFYTKKRSIRDIDNFELIQSAGIRHRPESAKEILKEMLYISIPITIGSSILPIVFMIDATMIMPRLHATGWSIEQAKVLYGLLGGYCYPITEFPQVFTIAVSVSLVPAVAEAMKRKDKTSLESNIVTGVKTLMLISFPCMVGLLIMAKPVLNLLYPARPDEVEMAAPVLQILAIGMVAFATFRAFSSVLQGAGKQGLPVRNLAIGAIAKVVLTYVLVGVPIMNVKGAAVGNIVTYFIAALLNYLSVRKHIGIKLSATELWGKPFILSCIMGIGTYIVYKLLMLLQISNSIATAISIIIAVITYFSLVFSTGYISREEAMMIPYGDKMLKIAGKMHVLRRENKN